MDSENRRNMAHLEQDSVALGCPDWTPPERKVWFVIAVLPGHPELNRLVHGVWDSHEGAKLAFDAFKRSRPDFNYGIASYPVYEKGQGY